jgi:hypothetical protein
MDSVERDQRAKDGFRERGEILFNRDSGSLSKKGKLDEKPLHKARFENEPQVSIYAGNPVIKRKVTPAASREHLIDSFEYDPGNRESKDKDKWQE